MYFQCSKKCNFTKGTAVTIPPPIITTTLATTTEKIQIVTIPVEESDGGLIPPIDETTPPAKDYKDGIIVYETDNPLSKEEIKKLEEELTNQGTSGESAKCESREASEKTFIRCEIKTESKDELDKMKIDANKVKPESTIKETIKYIWDPSVAEVCTDLYQNDCHYDATCDDTTGKIVCSCNEGFEDEVIIKVNNFRFSQYNFPFMKTQIEFWEELQ